MPQDTYCITLSSIARLPRHLKTLKIRGVKLINPIENDFKFETVFPPNLVNLSLEKLPNVTILDYLPDSLKTLRFRVDGLTPYVPWKVSKIPNGLTSLKMDCSSRFLEIDAQFPSGIEIFECLTCYSLSNKLTVEHLPKKLKIFPRALFLNSRDRESIIKRFPNLETALIDRETTVELLSETLKTLKIWEPIRLDSALPRGLTDLSISLPVPSVNLEHIPSSLTSLEVASAFLKESFFSAELIEQPWTKSDLDHIAHRMRLVSLRIEWRHIESAACLTPLANMQTLKKFEIGNVSWDGMIEAPKWIPQCLPSSLKELGLSADDPDADELSISEIEFWPLLSLEKVLPNLTSLKIYCGYEVLFSLTPKFAASLPRGLLNLDVHFETLLLQLGAVSQLPKCLQCLSIKSNSTTSDRFELSDAHFEGMPPNLAKFDLQTTYQHLVTPNLFEILPKSIASVDWLLEDEMKSSRRGRERF